MTTLGWICEVCHSEDATTFCLCEMILFCGECCSKHIQKKKKETHVCYPDIVARYRTVPGYFNRLQQRSQAINIGSAELRANLQRIDQCQEEFDEKLGALMTALRKFGLEQGQKLQKLKEELTRDIDESLTEAKQTEYEDEPTLKSKYAGTLRDASSQARLHLFDYQIKAKDNIPQYAIELMLGLDESASNLHYPAVAIAGDLEDAGEMLPQIRGNTMRTYRISTGQVASATLPVAFSNYSVFCLTQLNSVLCVGGCPATKNSYLLDMLSLNLKQTQPMITARGCPGIIKKGSNVYVFGGYSQNALTSCEKFEIRGETWTHLRDMQRGKSHFCPCALNDEIFLIDVSQILRSIEIFHVPSESFKTMSGSFPTSLGNANSITLVVDGEIVVLTCKKQIAKMRLVGETSFRMGNVPMNNKDSGYSNLAPVTVGRDVYWVRWNDGEIIKFSLDQLTVTD